MKSLYESTGRINDINTVLVPRRELDGLTKAARQALEALCCIHSTLHASELTKIFSAITALREALDAAHQPDAVGQEPVAYLYCGGQFGNELDEWEIDPEQYQCDKLNERFGALGKEARIPLYATPPVVAVEQEPVGHREPQPAAVNREQIREVFMAHGFTIKDGQTDLKQYVYDAAYALLAQCVAAKPARQWLAGQLTGKQIDEVLARVNYCALTPKGIQHAVARAIERAHGIGGEA